jgi:zinc/manganese transport system substrate-binding protein
MQTRRHLLLLAALLITSPAAAQDKLKVVATFSILGDLVKNVGGDRVEVAILVGPNGDAHVYSPAPGDAKTLAAAKLVFVNGLGLEGWITRLVKASGTKAPSVVVSTGIRPRKMKDSHGHSHGHSSDPHAWQSVANTKIYVANIRDALVKADAAGKAIYEANAAAYLGKLDALDGEVRAAITKIPPARRRIITSHEALGYFGEAYGVEINAAIGVSTGNEASARDVARIIAQVKRQSIPAVFMENISDERLMQQIARETGAKIGGTLYSDALSEPGGPAGSYVDMMRHNALQLSKALAN